MREVSTEFINDFKNYLLGKGLKEVSAINYLKHLRHIIKLAIQREWLGKYPFDGVSMEVPESNRGFFYQSELDALLNFHFADLLDLFLPLNSASDEFEEQNLSRRMNKKRRTNRHL